MPCECCLDSIKGSQYSLEKQMVGIWSIINYVFKKMQIWIRARPDLIFLKIPCLLPGGATGAGCRPGWLQCVGSQKFELVLCLWGGTVSISEMRSSSVALCGSVTSHLICPLVTDERACASSLRAVSTEFTVHMFRDMTLPTKGRALTLWWVGYAIRPLLFSSEKQYVLNISI